MASPLDPGGRIDGITLYRPGLLCTSDVIVLNLQARAKRAGFDAETGKLLWQNRLQAGNYGRGGGMLAFQGKLHAKGMSPSPIDLITGDAASGKTKWANPNLGWIDENRREGLNCNGYLTIFDGKLRFNSGNMRQAALDLETGEPIPSPVQPRILVDGDKAVTTGIGNIHDTRLVRGDNRPFFDVDTRLARSTRFALKLPGDAAESVFTVAPYETSRCMPVWDAKTLFVTRDERFQKNLQAWDIAATEKWVREIVSPNVATASRQYSFTLATNSLKDNAQPKPLWSKDVEVVGLAACDDAVLAITTAFENPRQRNGEQSWTLRAFEKTTGNEMWSVAMPGQPAPRPLAIRSDGTVVVALLDGTVVGVAE